MGSEQDLDAMLIYPWSVPATKAWSLDTGLLRLRDDSVHDLAVWLWEYGGSVAQQWAVIELMAHGDLRKGIGIISEIMRQHPQDAQTIRSQYPDFVQGYIDMELSELPGCVAEYSAFFGRPVRLLQ